MTEATEAALEKLCDWADVMAIELLNDEMISARVVYCIDPVMIRCVGDKIEWSVIHPSDYWAAPHEMEGWGGD